MGYRTPRRVSRAGAGGSMAIPDKSQGRVAAWRARQRLAGLVPVEVWVHPDQLARLRKYAGKLQNRSAERITQAQ